MRRGRLIVLTGIDGSGKTTQARILVNNLKNDGVKVSYVWTRWKQILVKPLTQKWKNRIKNDTGNSDGRARINKQKKKKLLSNPFLRGLWFVAFFLDYGLQILVKIRFRLIQKGLIVSDRIFYDSLIDQVINMGEKRNWLLDKLDSVWIKTVFPEPDMVLYIDCPEEIAFSRKDDAPDLEYLMDRRELYQLMAEKYKWITIDGTLPVDEIGLQIRNEVYSKLAVLSKS